MNTMVPVFSRFTLGHPMTQSIYTEKLPQPTETSPAANTPKAPKNKFIKVRR